MLELVRSESAWKKYLKKYKKYYNLNEFNISNEKPNSYPCILEKYLTTDLNGIKLKFIFIYKKDFKLFKEI